MKQWSARGPARWSWGAEGGPGVGVRRGGGSVAPAVCQDREGGWLVATPW